MSRCPSWTPLETLSYENVEASVDNLTAISQAALLRSGYPHCYSVVFPLSSNQTVVLTSTGASTVHKNWCYTLPVQDLARTEAYYLFFTATVFEVPFSRAITGALSIHYPDPFQDLATFLDRYRPTWRSLCPYLGESQPGFAPLEPLRRGLAVLFDANYFIEVFVGVSQTGYHLLDAYIFEIRDGRRTLDTSVHQHWGSRFQQGTIHGLPARRSVKPEDWYLCNEFLYQVNDSYLGNDDWEYQGEKDPTVQEALDRGLSPAAAQVSSTPSFPSISAAPTQPRVQAKL